MYDVGDRVELENGKIVTITKIAKTSEGIIYGYGKPAVVIEQEIIRKIED